MTKAYLLGALHDGTERKTTYRIGAKDHEYALFLKQSVENLGSKAWIYKEGRRRNYFIVEFSKSLLFKNQISSNQEKVDYIRGYFDTDGGIARSERVRYYIYFAQKDREDLAVLKNYLGEFGIESGIMHNPSKRKDPNYWRFFVRACSYEKFASLIGSWHPIKRKFVRMKI